MATQAKVPTNLPPLRVAVMWDDDTLFAEDIVEARPIVLGVGGIVAIPEGIGSADSVTLFEPTPAGYRLSLNTPVSGSVFLAGERHEIDAIRGRQSHVPIGPADYGVLLLGPLSIFFQHVRPMKPLPRPFMRVEPSAFAIFGLVFFLAIALGVLVVIDARRYPMIDDPFAELDPELIAQFQVEVPPPPPPAAAESGTETEDPGLRSRDEAGGERHEGEEGRVGRETATQEDTHIEGEVTEAVNVRVRSMGLLGALSGGGEDNALEAALDVPTISDILGGMGAGPTVVGRGSGGAGLRGIGSGGGGTGPGSLFGAGNMGTGVGAGGRGMGRGSGGVGVPGRARTEVQISVRTGTPRVSGYLSPEQINRVVRANQAAIRYCYEVEVQRQPNLRGTVNIEWRINLSGAVTTARVSSTTLRNPSVEGCIVRQVRRWRFPEPDGGEVRVDYPFVFGIGG